MNQDQGKRQNRMLIVKITMESRAQWKCAAWINKILILIMIKLLFLKKQRNILNLSHSAQHMHEIKENTGLG